MRARLSALAVRLAGPAGRAARSLPGILGAILVCVGLGLIYVPLALLAAGAFLLLIDRQVA